MCTSNAGTNYDVWSRALLKLLVTYEVKHLKIYILCLWISFEVESVSHLVEIIPRLCEMLAVNGF